MLSTRADVEAGEQVDAVQQERMVELRLGERITVSIMASTAAPRKLQSAAKWGSLHIKVVRTSGF